MADSRIEKWRRWCGGPIRDDVHEMHIHRYVYREVAAITRGAGLPTSYYFAYLGETYATTQMVAIRRQADTNGRVQSLGRLLTELADHPRITRTFYIEMWGGDEAAGSRAFDLFAGKDGEHIDPAQVRHDLASLSTTASSVKDYVNEYIAHSDREAKAAVPAFEDVDAAIDSIGALFKKYNSLLTADIITLTPVIQHDWKAVFRQPWIAPG